MRYTQEKERIYLLLTLFVILFSVLTILVAFGITDGIDKQVSEEISDEPDGSLFNLMEYITRMGSVYFLLPASIIVMIVFYYLKETLLSILYASLMLSLVPAYRIVKYILGRPRPEIGFIHETGYSYPSGHTVASFTFFMGLYVFYQILYKNEHNVPLLLLCIILSFLVGISRMILGVHYLTDVLGGVLLGGILIMVFSVIFEKMNRELEDHD